MPQVMHWIGVVLLIVSFALLIVSTVTAPVFHDLGMFKVNFATGETAYFGTFGYCFYPANNDGPPQCTSRSIGYKPSHAIARAEGTSYDFTGEGTADVLTNAMVLHPVAAGVTFIAILVAFIPGAFGALFASFVTSLAWLVTVIVMALDFALFGILKGHFDNDNAGTTAKYSVGSWTVLAAMVLLFFATFFILFSCCSRRRERKREKEGKAYNNGANGTYNGGYSY